MLLWMGLPTTTEKPIITTPLWYKVVNTLHIKPMTTPTKVVDMMSVWCEEFARA